MATQAQASTQKATANAQQAQAKSGLKKLSTGEVLFEDGAVADSLYIIQKGQLRLYKPKGKGFIEIAVLRAGEVIGEMAFFDQSDPQGGRRSCAAMALVPSEVIEISFAAFKKRIEGLNPWFKTIIQTLADRLRKTNGRVKELESNSVAHDYGTGGGYQFFKTIDVIRLFSVFYLVFKTHGGDEKEGHKVHRNVLNRYAIEIFNVLEVKLEEFINLLKEQGILKICPDEDNLPKMLVIKKIHLLHAYMSFFNTQRVLTDEKKLKISKPCENFLDKVLEQLASIPDNQDKAECNISNILKENSNLTADDLLEAKKYGFAGENIVDKGVITCEINLKALRKAMPAIKMMGAIKAVNDQKAKQAQKPRK